MKQMLVVAIAILMAGCLGSEDGSDSTPEPEFQDTEDPFFAGIPFDANLFDINDLSTIQFGVLQSQEWVTMSDGVAIDNHVFMPDGEGPFPVFINFSPYWGNTAELGGDGFSNYLIDNFVTRGYVVVLSALRGTGHSGGCFEIASDREVADLAEIIREYAAKPYSNGNVATGGKSYDSTPQNGLIAQHDIPELKGMFHVSGITDMYRYNIKDGVPSVNGLAFTPRYYATQSYDEVVSANGATLLNQEVVLRTVEDAVCPEAAEHVAHGEAAAATGLKSDYWQEREWTAQVSESSWNGSIFFVHGFQDWNVKPDNILPWLENLPEEIHVLAWLHQDTANGGHVYPMRTDWNLTMLRWMDETLKGIDAGIGREDRYELEGDDGRWRVTPEYLDESDEIPVIGMQLDTEATRITGKVTIRAMVTPQTVDPIFTATLYAKNDGGRTWAGEAVARLIYQDSLYAPSLIVPGVPMEVEVEFFPLDTIGLEGFEIELGTGSLKNVVLVEGLTYGDVSGVYGVALGDGNELDPQPVATICHAC